MKRILLLTFFFIFLLPFLAGAAIFTVSQSGSGKDYSILTFNALFGNKEGNIYYFNGDITSEIIPSIYGTSGNHVILDGYQSNNTYFQNCSEASGRAKVDRSWGTNGIRVTAKNYITIQDFEVTNAVEGIIINGSVSTGSSNITVKRCYVHNMTNRGFFSTTSHPEYASRNSNIIIGGSPGNGNVAKNCGTATTGYDIKVAWTDNAVISYNHCYANTTSYGISGISWEGDSTNMLVEYNEVHDHNKGTEGENGIGGKAAHNVIVRFNHVYNHFDTDHFGIGQAGSWTNYYVYGNYVHDNAINMYFYDGPNGTPGFYYDDCGDGTRPTGLHVWSNIIHSSLDWSGILLGSTNCTGTDNPPDNMVNVNIYNNVIAKNATVARNSQETGLHLRGNISDAKVKNNIFYKNRPNEGDYKHIHHGYGEDVNNISLEHNQYYADSTSYVYWNGDLRTVAWLKSNGLEDDSPAGADGVPGFTNAVSDIYTLLGTSSCKNTGANLSGLAGSFSIAVYNNGAPINMYYDDCLPDNSYVNFSITPPIASPVKQGSYPPPSEGGPLWEKGAYVFTGGGGVQLPPTVYITNPPSNVTVAIDGTQSLECEGTDPEGDTLTYTWVIPADTFEHWLIGITYLIGNIVEHPDSSGTYYKSKVDNNLGNTPAIDANWENAETQQYAGTGTVDAAGIYTIGVTANDGTVDSVPKSVTITVPSAPYTPPIGKVWTHNSGYDYNTDAIAYINGGTGGCSDSPTTSQTTQDMNDAIVNFTEAQYYWGGNVTKAGGYSDVCRIDVMLTDLGVDASDNYYYLEVWSKSGSDLGTLLGASSTSGNTSWSSSWVTFNFSNIIATISSGDVITISAHETDTANYVGLHYDDTTNSATDVTGLSKYNSSKVHQYTWVDDDWAIKVYEAGTELGDTNYETATSVYAKKITIGINDNQKIPYLVDLVDLLNTTTNDATIELWLETASSTPINIEVWSVVDNFTEAGVTDNCAVDNVSNGCTTAWTGTHGQTTFLGEVAFNSSSSIGQYYQWNTNDLTSHIGSIGTAGGVLRLIFISDAEDSTAIAFASDECTTDGRRPKLTIDYDATDPSSVPEIVNITTTTPNGSYTYNIGNLLTNGTFDSNPALPLYDQWTLGDGWSVADGKAVCDGSQGLPSSLLNYPPGFVQGAAYGVTFTISDYAAGNLKIYLGDDGVGGAYRSANGTYSENLIFESTTWSWFQVWVDAAFEGKLDDIIMVLGFNTFQVSFSEPVDVIGIPQLKLNSDTSGANDVLLDYASGSGTAMLTFDGFAVTPDHITSDLDGIQLDLNGGTIVSSDDSTAAAGDPLTVFPTGPSTPGSLAYNKDISIDVSQPTVTSVNNTDSHATADTGGSPITSVGTLVTFAIDTDAPGYEVASGPDFPRIEMLAHPIDSVYADYIGVGDATDIMIMGFHTRVGMRSEDLNFTGDLDLGQGGIIKDAAGNVIDVDMGVLSLAAVATIEIAVADQWTLTTGNNYVDWDAFIADTYSVPGDGFNVNFTGNLDADNSGVQRSLIAITGSITGNATFDEDYWAITNLDVSGLMKITGKYITVE